MTRLSLLVAVLIVMLFGSPAFGQLAPQSDTCDGCPFDQGAELDAACPNGICSFFVGGNFTFCQAWAQNSQYCFSCGKDVLSGEISCQRTAKSAACGCSITQKNGVTTGCQDKGSCSYNNL